MNGYKNIIAVMSGMLICLLLIGTAAADSEFSITGAETVDRDGDGYIDAYEITFSENVNDSTFDSSSWTIGDYTGYSLDTGAANDEVINITFNQKATPDTEITPDITTTGAGIYSNGSDEALPSVTTEKVDEEDGAAPVIISATTLDSDENGLLDNYTIEFSEAINDSTLNDSNWNVEGMTISGNNTGVAEDTIMLELIEGTDNKTTMTSNVSVTGAEVTDIADNSLVDVTIDDVTDGAGPVFDSVDSAVTGATDGVLGIGDTITFTATPNATEDGLDIVSDSYNGVDLEWSTNDNGETYNATYTVAKGQDLSTPLNITNVTATDAVGNEGPSVDGDDVLVTIDATYPEIESAQTIDANENGKIDGYKITFTESVDDSTYNNSLWSIEDHVAEELNTVNEANDSTVIVNINESESQDVDQTPDFEVSEDAIRDSAGNPILGVTSVTIDVTDGAAPVVLNATTVDSDGNGLLDGYNIEFSEAITDSTLNYSKWNVAGMSITGYDTGDAADDNIIMLELIEGTGNDTTKTPDITVSDAEVTDIAGNELDNVASGDVTEKDGAGPVIDSVTCDATGVLGIGDTIVFSVTLNQFETGVTILPEVYNGGALVWSEEEGVYNATYEVKEGQDLSPSLNLTDVNATDAAGNVGPSIAGNDMQATIDATRPYIENATTIDLDGNGSIDGYAIEFSEAINDSTLNTSKWTVDGMTINGNDTGVQENDSIIILNFTESGDYNANTAPNVTTDLGAIADMAGNDINSTSETDVTEEDGSAPVIESVTSDATEEGVLGIGDTINFTVTMAYEEEVNITSDKYNGENLTDWTTGDSGLTYNATYTVEEGHMSRLNPLNLTGVIATDDAENEGSPKKCTDVNKTIDAGGPIVVAAETVDTDNNGMIDGYNLTFTEPINDSTFNYENWDVENYTVTGFNTSEGSDDRYGILVFEEGNSTDTDAVPAFNNVSTPEVEDADGNLMPEEFGEADYLNELTEDGAAPVLMHAEIDSFKSACCDAYAVNVNFSESVYDNDDGNVTFNTSEDQDFSLQESWYFEYNDQLQTGDSPEITAVNNMIDESEEENAAVLYGGENVTVNTFRKELKAGYNYVSFPIADRGDVTLADVGLASDQVEDVFMYDAEAGQLISDTFEDFEIEGGQGYIINASEDFVLAPNVNNLPGEFESPASTNLCEGWNLVGHYSAQAQVSQATITEDGLVLGTYGSFSTLRDNLNDVMWYQKTPGNLQLNSASATYVSTVHEYRDNFEGHNDYSLDSYEYGEPMLITTGDAYWINVDEDDQYSQGSGNFFL